MGYTQKVMAGIEAMNLSSNFQLIYTIILLSIVALAALAYAIRTQVKGKAHFDRVDRQGGSALLNKGLMEGGYWILQPFGRLLAAAGITPNQISWGSLILGLIAGVCLAFGHFGSAAVFATISALFDALDGMVARLTGVASDAGEVLDATADRYVEFFFLGGLVIYYREILPIMILALVALVGSFMVSYSSAKAEALGVDPPKGSMRRPERALYLTLGAVLSPVTIPWLEATREFPIAIAHPMVVALGLVAVLANISAMERLWEIAVAVRRREDEVKQAQRRVEATILEEKSEESHAHVGR